MEFDKYNGPVFLTTPDGKKIVPILLVERDFLIGATLCARTQFPLIICSAITVHKSQSIIEDMIRHRSLLSGLSDWFKLRGYLSSENARWSDIGCAI
jgi:hypothetical protein